MPHRMGVAARRARAALVVGAALLVGACSLPPATASPVIDTWPIGDQYQCSGGDARCAALVPAAIKGLDRWRPGHADVVTVKLHREGILLDALGNPILLTRSGDCCSVAVFQLAGGEVRAIGVGYPGISPEPEAVLQGP